MISGARTIFSRAYLSVGFNCDLVGDGGRWSLTELPSVSAEITHNECCHRLISGSSLELVVRAVLALAFAALEQIGLRSLNRRLEKKK